MYHSKIAKALEQRPDRNAALLAVHCEEAGEPNKAFQFWIEAGEQAHAISSLEEAEAAFQRAERLIPHCPTLNDEQIHYLYLLWDDMAYQVNNTETLKRIHQTQLNIGQSRNSALLTGAALDGQGNACMTANQFEAGLEYAQKALVWLEGTNHIFERMEVLNHRGTFHYMLGHMDIALESFQAALELCENASVPLDRWMLRARGNTNYYIAQIQTLKIWPKIGEEYALKALNDYVACKHPYGQASAYSVLTLAHYHLGNFEEGIRVGQIGIELAERISAWRILGNLHSYCAMNEFERGFLGPAWDHIQKALDLGNRFGHGETLAIAYRTIGDIYDRLWSNDKALDAYKKGIEAGGSHFLSQDNLMGMGTTLAQSNQEIGEQYIQQAIIQTEKIGSDSLYGSFSLLYLETMSGMANENTISRIRKGADEAKKREWGYVHHGLLFLLAKALLENGHLQESLSITNELIRFDSLWHKLLANNLQIHIFQALELSDVQPFADQERYISEIEAHLGDAPLQEEWQTFKQMLLSTSEP
jgi:tetratricopeptide (TPR) repeat protein